MIFKHVVKGSENILSMLCYREIQMEAKFSGALIIFYD